MADMLFHICTEASWQAAQAEGAYRADSLTSEGFIHCSYRHQLAGVANAFFAGRRDLVVLTIDPARLEAPVRDEGEPRGPLFPHVYGAIGLAAVVAVGPYQPGPDGQFLTPASSTDRPA